MRIWYKPSSSSNTAIKPFFFLDLLEHERFDQVIFLDPDIVLFPVPLTGGIRRSRHPQIYVLRHRTSRRRCRQDGKARPIIPS